MKEAAEELRANFGQMMDEMKKLREESEASEQEVGSCEDCVVPLKENTDQLAVNMREDSSAHYVFDEIPKMEIGWNHLGECVNLNLEVKSNLGASLVNSEGIAMIDDIARKVMLKNMNRDSVNMIFSLRSSLKGNSPFSLLEFRVMDGSRFSEDTSSYDAHTVMGELMANSFDPIDIGMNNFRKISVTPFENCSTYQMSDKMPMRSVKGYESSIQLNSAPLFVENWVLHQHVFDPGINKGCRGKQELDPSENFISCAN